MTEITILDEAAVSEIEAGANGNVKEPGTYMFLLSRVLPLCATVKHLRQMLADPIFGLRDLQSQLEQLRATLAQVEQERDALRDTIERLQRTVPQRLEKL